MEFAELFQDNSKKGWHQWWRWPLVPVCGILSGSVTIIPVLLFSGGNLIVTIIGGALQGLISTLCVAGVAPYGKLPTATSWIVLLGLLCGAMLALEVITSEKMTSLQHHLQSLMWLVGGVIAISGINQIKTQSTN